MTSPSKARLGLSLLEVLVVLAIMALIIGVAVPALRAPPHHLALQEQIALLEREALAIRLAAIRGGLAQPWQPDGPRCAGQLPARILYLPDGSAFGDPFCLRRDDQDLWLTVAPLTGRIVTAKAPVQ
ncbi:hypothetical protein So717_37160 [Roseobacter cerasinus]|uniref:General secretion pathway protein H n=1 Tax=Roseobacter cerasinus TaxID=2602289 RepID=A0A640VUY2_9RHOB|nr:prepilin-type N-terminal cleavage/methylation domain-containing protein [Roseobacter cerasinus]GFE51963.1 hypothetical protein So717_37160 [Roseobacter cerasinus]